MEAIETIGLTKRYLPPGRLKKLFVKSPIKREILAVDNVDLRVKQGELIGLIGPNGAGKTTLIKMLVTLLLPSTGRALVDGSDIVEQEGAVKSAIGFVSSEERSFCWRLTGRENLAFFAALQNLGSHAARERVAEVMRMLDLDAAADDMYFTYSSGMKQKLNIARGLLRNPKILFLDEPTKSVDAVMAKEIKRLVKEEIVGRQGRTVVFTSHRLEEVEEICERVAIMNKGRIRFTGTLAELRQHMRSKDRHLFEVKRLGPQHFNDVGQAYDLDYRFANGNGSGVYKFEFEFKNGEDSISPVLRRLLDDGGEIVSLTRHRPGLQDLFHEYLDEKA